MGIDTGSLLTAGATAVGTAYGGPVGGAAAAAAAGSITGSEKPAAPAAAAPAAAAGGAPSNPSLTSMAGGAAKQGLASGIQSAAGAHVSDALYSPRRAGKATGDRQRAHANAAFPGTSPWDQLGGNSGAPGQAPAGQANSAASVARINAAAQKYSSDNAVKVAKINVGDSTPDLPGKTLPQKRGDAVDADREFTVLNTRLHEQLRLSEISKNKHGFLVGVRNALADTMNSIFGTDYEADDEAVGALMSSVYGPAGALQGARMLITMLKHSPQRIMSLMTKVVQRTGKPGKSTARPREQHMRDLQAAALRAQRSRAQSMTRKINKKYADKEARQAHLK